MPFDFVVHPIRWERCPLVVADLHANSWLTLQSHRGLASNNLDAYSRALERYLGLLKLHPWLLPGIVGLVVGYGGTVAAGRDGGLSHALEERSSNSIYDCNVEARRIRKPVVTTQGYHSVGEVAVGLYPDDDAIADDAAIANAPDDSLLCTRGNSMK